MPKHKIVTDFSNIKDDELVQKAQHIITCLSDNIYFSDTVPSLTKIKDASTAYQTALLKFHSGVNWDEILEKKKTVRNLKRC